MDKRINTPWGLADGIELVGESGIFFASTPSHGGYFVPNSLLNRISEENQERAFYWSNSRNWYEEDCEWASVVIAFPALFTPKQQQRAKETIANRTPLDNDIGYFRELSRIEAKYELTREKAIEIYRMTKANALLRGVFDK